MPRGGSRDRGGARGAGSPGFCASTAPALPLPTVSPAPGAFSAGVPPPRRAVAPRPPHEILLLDLYNALRPIDEITGATTTDDILNLIFSRFCIGK